MLQPDEHTVKSEPFINVRKLAALDIVFHGPGLILAEFAFGIVLCATFGLWSLLGPIHSTFIIIVGCYLLGIALNYVPLLLYAISIVRRKSARQEVAYELAHKDASARKYTMQTTVLLLVPLVLLLLAVYQEVRRRLLRRL